MKERGDEHLIRTIEPNPDTEPMYAAVADYKRKFGLVETLRKLQMMTGATREMVEDQCRSVEALENAQPLTGAIH
jgi:hypothetical protein